MRAGRAAAPNTEEVRLRRRGEGEKKPGGIEVTMRRALGMGLGGVEPPTSRLSGVRSNHLSYRPALLRGKQGKLKLLHLKIN
jgi:hypothetical protein